MFRNNDHLFVQTIIGLKYEWLAKVFLILKLKKTNAGLNERSNDIFCFFFFKTWDCQKKLFDVVSPEVVLIRLVSIKRRKKINFERNLLLHWHRNIFLRNVLFLVNFENAAIDTFCRNWLQLSLWRSYLKPECLSATCWETYFDPFPLNSDKIRTHSESVKTSRKVPPSNYYYRLMFLNFSYQQILLCVCILR